MFAVCGCFDQNRPIKICSTLYFYGTSGAWWGFGGQGLSIKIWKSLPNRLLLASAHTRQISTEHQQSCQRSTVMCSVF